MLRRVSILSQVWALKHVGDASVSPGSVSYALGTKLGAYHKSW